jgi:hypothetical protein
MPLSSVFEKLKLRRGSNSNPPSPTSSSGINREGRASSDQYHSRKSVDQPRVSSNVSRDAPARAYGAEQAGESTGFRGQELVGAHNHVDGNTEVARNANAALERDPNNSQHQTAQVPQQYQQRESRDAPRENLDQGHGRTGSGLTGRGEGKGLPPIPGVSGRDDRDHAQHAREPVAAAQRTPSKVPASSRNVGSVGNNQFDADGFPIVAKTSSSSSSSKSESGLPRSHGTFALPTVPQTPAFSDEVQAGLLDRSVGGSAPAPGLRERFELDAGSMGYIPVDDHRHGLGFGSKDVAGSSEKPAEWREIGSGPLIKQHQLTTPRQLAPYKVTDPNVIAEESRRFVAAQSKVGRLEPNHIGTVARGQGERDGEFATAGSTQSALSAYIPIREYAFHPSPPGATDPSPEHIQRHLALLSNSFTHSRMSRIGAGASKPGKYTPLIPGIPVSTTERDRELINQREGLVSRIAREEAVAERSGARGIKPKNGLDERSVEVFKQAGWESKVGVLDTVDVKSRVLEPVIQVGRCGACVWTANAGPDPLRFLDSAGTRRYHRDRGLRAHDLQGHSQVPHLVSLGRYSSRRHYDI